MSYQVKRENAGPLFDALLKRYEVYAPVLFDGDGAFSDTGTIRYRQLKSPEDFARIEFDKKSDYSFKEIITPLCQNLFYFNEESAQEAGDGAGKDGKDYLVFARSCDIHAIKRLDAVFLDNGGPDYYYARLRRKPWLNGYWPA